MSELTRRQFLEAAGAAGITAVTASAGCMETDESTGVLAREDYDSPEDADFSPYEAVEARVEDLQVFGDQYRDSNDDRDLIDVITVGTAYPRGSGVRTFAQKDFEVVGNGYDFYTRDVREHRIGSPRGNAVVGGIEAGGESPLTDLGYDDGLKEEPIVRLRGPVRIMAEDKDRDSLQYVLDIDSVDAGVDVPEEWYPEA